MKYYILKEIPGVELGVGNIVSQRYQNVFDLEYLLQEGYIIADEGLPLLKREKDNDEWYTKPYICPHCNVLFMVQDKDIHFCPKCGGKYTNIFK